MDAPNTGAITLIRPRVVNRESNPLAGFVPREKGTTVGARGGATLARMPAFAQSLPSVPETALAAVVTVLAGLAGGVLARGAVEQLERVLARD